MENLTTENRNPRSMSIDQMSALEIAGLINSEDANVISAVQLELPAVGKAIEMIAENFRNGGRLFYIGAGTSGRLGVLDASECPPTFNTPPEMVVGIIAGGERALTTAVEGAEDDTGQAERDLQKHGFSNRDLLVGIATSGRTPYVLGGLRFAASISATCIGITCNANTELHALCQLTIAPIVGPEVLSGSTRLKAGTATKLVLNMLTTGAMILIGKTYGNLMVDLRASNTKLKIRSQRIVSEITGLAETEAASLLLASDGELKTAIVSALCGVDVGKARELLRRAEGRLHDALQLEPL